MKNGEPNHVKFSDPPASLVGAEGEYKPKEPKLMCCFHCGNDAVFVQKERENSQGKAQSKRGK